MNLSKEARSLWHGLVECENIENLLYELIGRATLLNINLLTGSYASIIGNERRFLFRLIWTIDSQRLAVLLWPQRKATAGRDMLLRLLFHIIALGSTNGNTDGFKLSTIDWMVRRRLLLDCILSIFRLLTLTGVEITTDEEDALRSRLDDMVEDWNSQHELSLLERNILPDLIVNSIENHESIPNEPIIDAEIPVSIFPCF